MGIDLYDHERCTSCGDIRRELRKRDVDYEGHYFPPKNPDIKALEGGKVTDPVLVDDELAPDGVVGHEEILEWIKENY